jgi:hypothetical protein
MTVRVDSSLEGIYAGLGYAHQPAFMSAVVGTWLDNAANQG